MAILSYNSMMDSLGPRRPRFWAALIRDGVWEKDFLQNYHTMAVQWRVPDFENSQNVEHLRLGKTEFWSLHDEYGRFLEKKNPGWRVPVASHKRFALQLHWLAHAPTFTELARTYAIGKSTVVEIVHETICILRREMVTKAIRFPEGKELKRNMAEFKALCKLERCAGAFDGTIMKIRKPSVDFAESYWCYKKHCAIIILATVCACGVFTNVNAGRAGAAGDAAVFGTSQLLQKSNDRKWLTIKETRQEKFKINGTYIRPYLVADSAFPLAATVMKCYDDNNGLLPFQKTFNHRVIRTRCVVEQAFGNLKDRFHILVDNNLNDPVFATDIALVCCALQNVCERWNCPVDKSWLVDPTTYDKYHPAPTDQPHEDFDQAGFRKRNKLAHFVHQLHPVVWASQYSVFYILDTIEVYTIMSALQKVMCKWYFFRY